MHADTQLREDARAQSARGVQRAALRREDGCAVALDARRPAAVGRGLPAGPGLAAGCFGQRADDLPRAKRGFVLLPPRWVVERSYA